MLGNATPTATGANNISLNASGVSVVQGWVSTPANNKGLMLWAGANTDGLDFSSKENGTATNRPRLSVTYCDPVAVGNEVWVDSDGNGLQDTLGTTEFPGGDVTVKLWSVGADTLPYTSDDTVVQNTVSTRALSYGFSGIPNGTYYVEFVPPAGYALTTKYRGGATGPEQSGTDSDADPNSGLTDPFTYSGAPIQNIDAGFKTVPLC